ncbi:glycosyltransferase [Pengzhenrongella sicca]|uniref:Glycosyltransferase n=1 Tax=Pengzhenrongella sicca TaxID=2819238 RepID=A0A8A4ZEM6_9MICO|nr:glycosyltransferase [Pengzhenrongella sicca]QTE29861.1 glycosyltransferase [Pengzhenrongella sicca]
MARRSRSDESPCEATAATSAPIGAQRAEPLRGERFQPMREGVVVTSERERPNVEEEPLVLKNPTVSVLVPTYNGARFLGETLTSIQTQTYRNLRVLIRDDGSSDATLEIARAFASADPRFTLIEGTDRAGAAANCVELLKAADGEYVRFCMQDDLVDRQGIEKLLRPMHAEPAISLATSVRLLIDETGRQLPGRSYTEPLVGADDILSGEAVARRMLLLNLNQIGEPSTVLFRNGLVDPARPFSYGATDFDANGDVALWLTLLAKGHLFYSVKPLSSFRQHGAQRSVDPAVLIDGALEWVELLRVGLSTGVLERGEQSLFAAKNVIAQLLARISAVVSMGDGDFTARVADLAAAVTRAWSLGVDGSAPVPAPPYAVGTHSLVGR